MYTSHIIQLYTNAYWHGVVVMSCQIQLCCYTCVRSDAAKSCNSLLCFYMCTHVNTAYINCSIFGLYYILFSMHLILCRPFCPVIDHVFQQIVVTIITCYFTQDKRKRKLLVYMILSSSGKSRTTDTFTHVMRNGSK